MRFEIGQRFSFCQLCQLLGKGSQYGAGYYFRTQPCIHLKAIHDRDLRSQIGCATVLNERSESGATLPSEAQK